MKKFELELETFRHRLVDMGNLAEKMVRYVSESLADTSKSDVGAALVGEEERLDAMQLDIDKEAIRLLTVYSPVAGDLRMIMSISRITTELERIGDHVMNICESLELMQRDGSSELQPVLLRMSKLVCGMVHDALNAFAQNDIAKAHSTIASDNVVDALNDQIFGDLLRLDVIRDKLENATDIAGPLSQLLIARSLERIADQATNISEEVVYMVKGRDIRHQVD